MPIHLHFHRTHLKIISIFLKETQKYHFKKFISSAIFLSWKYWKIKSDCFIFEILVLFDEMWRGFVCVQPTAQGSPLRDALAAQHRQGVAREPRLFGRRGQLNVIRDERERSWISLGQTCVQTEPNRPTRNKICCPFFKITNYLKKLWEQRKKWSCGKAAFCSAEMQ
jgi:hypothetical protein